VTQAAITGAFVWLLWVLAKGFWAWLASAEWGVVTSNLRLFAVYQYPADADWRLMVALLAVSGALGVSAGMWRGVARELAAMLAATYAVLLALPVLQGPITGLSGPSLGALSAAFGQVWSWFAGGLALVAAGWLAAWAVDRRLEPESRARRRVTRWLRLGWLASLPVVLLLLHGVGDVVVPLRLWGGLLLTIVLAIAALVLAFPLGIVLALGRRSSLPLVRTVSILYIELIRGVPLVTVLFMASLMVPLVLPDGVRPEMLVRAVVGFAMFTAAYIAEDVRGGLAALGVGQYEASRALGLSTFSMNRLVILPQAIRVIIPSLVGHFISLFKDTSLVVIVGLRELMGVAMVVVNQPEWLGLFREALLFIAIIYFVLSSAMSRASRHLEVEEGAGV
jgi:general L-amino acid transport system permease protein